MLINISSGFNQNRKKNILGDFFHIFQLRTLKITVNTLTTEIFHGLFSNLARNFIALRSRTSSIVLGSASLDMSIMDHLISWPLWTFLDSFVKLKLPKNGTNVGVNMLFSITSGVYHHWKNIWRIRYAFSNFAHIKTLLALSSHQFFSWNIFKCGKHSSS